MAIIIYVFQDAYKKTHIQTEYIWSFLPFTFQLYIYIYIYMCVCVCVIV